jgi:hypothetical protein
MKFLKSLLGKDKDETPTWDIKPPSERPPARRGKSLPVANAGPKAAHANNAPTKPKKDPHPFMDDPMLDTMTLEVDLTADDDDPYSTHSYTTGLENENRRLKTIQIGTKTEKKASADFNPYDTGKMRRSWKK